VRGTAKRSCETGDVGITGQRTNEQTVKRYLLTGGNMVISSKGGILKIWEETLLLLLLGLD
jgi:hypothetical protein